MVFGLFGKKPSLKGKVAIVTGGTKGIGLAIADKLRSEGATVVVCARTMAKTKHMCIPVDVSKPEDVKRLVEETIKKYKRVDILVNNAGIFPNNPLIDMTEEQWNQVISINLNGIFNCTKAVLPSMIQQRYGKIINIASIAGTKIGYPGLTHYCTTKAGVSGFTKSAAAELAQHNIRVNAIAPGLILTPGVEAFMPPEDQAKFVKNSIPIGRIGKPEDIAALAAFLASDAADNITGQTIISDGGTTIQ
jgi:3-oxoacyl-[acyl-carrier protein] reductase